MKKLLLITILFIVSSVLFAQEYETLNINPLLKDFQAVKAPETSKLLLKKGDRLAICGDSITEQKMYSRIIETYLTVCEPQMDITVRQYGWGGETAQGFLSRMKNDCLRFNPTIATTCYGMNDFRYVPYTDQIGQEYRDNMSAIVELFKENDTRVVLGSAGCVGKRPSWQKNTSITAKDLNLSLLKLRNIDLEIAGELDVTFADVFLPMFLSTYKAQTLYGSDFKVVGDDGVHPDWAGHIIMAYAFLKAMGLDGAIGTISVDLKTGKTTTDDGHKVISTSAASASAGNSENTVNQSAFSVTLESGRYPYCDQGAFDQYNSVRAGMNLVPFNETLNRLMLVVRNTEAKNYKVSWGQWEKTYTPEQLNAGVNLAADFVMNPFVEPFNAVSEAVKKKQEYETHQIKSLFHGEEGTADMEGTIKRSEAERMPLVENIATTFKPVQHTIKIVAE